MTTPEKMADPIESLAPWFHNLHLPDGRQTAPDHALGDFPATKWKYLAAYIPDDLSGWTVLDIGCNAGFYTFEMAKRGANVSAIDIDPRYLAQAAWAADQFGLGDRVTLKQMQVYDLAHLDEQFDIVLFMGVFYHLRYPMLGLDIVAQKVRRLLVFQSLSMPGKDVFEETYHLNLLEREAMLEQGWPKMSFIEHRIDGDPTNWWVPNHAGIEAMLRSAGMRIQPALKHELYICEPDPDRPSCMTTWNKAEFLSATGRPWK